MKQQAAETVPLRVACHVKHTFLAEEGQVGQVLHHLGHERECALRRVLRVVCRIMWKWNTSEGGRHRPGQEISLRNNRRMQKGLAKQRTSRVWENEHTLYKKPKVW